MLRNELQLLISFQIVKIAKKNYLLDYIRLPNVGVFEAKDLRMRIWANQACKLTVPRNCSESIKRSIGATVSLETKFSHCATIRRVKKG